MNYFVRFYKLSFFYQFSFKNLFDPETKKHTNKQNKERSNKGTSQCILT